MNFKKNKIIKTEPLEKVPKLKINTSLEISYDEPYVESYVEPPLTQIKDLDNLRESTRNFVIDNEVLYNKLQSVQDDIRELIRFLKKIK
jgi:hypothetical protein